MIESVHLGVGGRGGGDFLPLHTIDLSTEGSSPLRYLYRDDGATPIYIKETEWKEERKRKERKEMGGNRRTRVQETDYRNF